MIMSVEAAAAVAAMAVAVVHTVVAASVPTVVREAVPVTMSLARAVATKRVVTLVLAAVATRRWRQRKLR